MKPLRREYMMSNAELCMLASNFIIFLAIDATEFVTRGI